MADQTTRSYAAGPLLTALGGAAGIGLCISALGGLREWAKLSSAGLPVNSVTAGFDVRSLFAEGAGTLTVLPLLLVFLCIGLVLDARVSRDREFGRAMRGLGRILGTAAAVSFAVVVSTAWILTAVVFVARAYVRSGWLLAVGVAAVLFIVVSGSLPVVRWVRGIAARKAHGASATDRPHDESDSVPTPSADTERGSEPRLAALRKPTHAMRRWRVRLALAVTSVALAVPLEAIARSRVPGVATAMALVLVVLWIAPTLALLDWFDRRVDLVVSPPPDRTGGATTTVVIATLVAGFVAVGLPLFGTIAVLGAVVIASVTDISVPAVSRESNRVVVQDWVRLAAVAVVLTFATIAWSAGPPERFDRIDIPLAKGHAEFAFLGEHGGDLVLAGCAADHGVSRPPVVVRVPRDRLGTFAIVRGGFAFYRRRSPTLVSGLVHWSVFDSLRPASAPEALHAFGTARVRNVCGTGTGLPLPEARTELERIANR